MIRDQIKDALVHAMKAREKERVAALRLVQAALKNRDIELRTAPATADDDSVVLDVLAKMAKQRRESIDLYEKGGRHELAAAEHFELAVIERFLPEQLADDAAAAAIGALVRKCGASSVRDMGKVMALVKAELHGKIDMGKASALVKAALS